MRWQAPVVFLSLSCDRSQLRHDISCIGSNVKIVRTVSHPYVVHLLNFLIWQFGNFGASYSQLGDAFSPQVYCGFYARDRQSAQGCIFSVGLLEVFMRATDSQPQGYIFTTDLLVFLCAQHVGECGSATGAERHTRWIRAG